METKKSKQSGQLHTVIGIGAILLAALIVLLAFLMPRALQKREIKQQIAAFSRDGLLYITLSDPLFETGDLLGNRGKEILLDEGQRGEVALLTQRILAGGLRYDGQKVGLAATADLRLFAKAQEESYCFYVSEEGFYFFKGDAAYCFKAKESDAHIALLAALRGYLAE